VLLPDWSSLWCEVRFFDKEGISPLFPFGWGLSYTTYSYSALKVAAKQLSAEVVTGNVIVPGGDWCDVIDSTITGNVQLGLASTGVRVMESTIDGNLDSTGTVKAADPLSSGTDVVCSTAVKSNVSILFSASTVPWNLGQCGADTINGNVTFDGNSAAGSSITATTIDGSLNCLADGSVATSGKTDEPEARAVERPAALAAHDDMTIAPRGRPPSGREADTRPDVLHRNGSVVVRRRPLGTGRAPPRNLKRCAAGRMDRAGLAG
jgi:hypothetical protein